MGYWKYYADDFAWSDGDEHIRQNLERTREAFSQFDLSSTDVESFIRSGYIMLADDVIIDRFYGGALSSADYRSRIPISAFMDWYKETKNSPVQVVDASSMDQVLDCVEKWRSHTRKPLAYRGQTQHFALTRERPNPAFHVPGMGEISLLPSLWRAMNRKNPSSFASFESLSLHEWTRVALDQFDQDEIDRRVKEKREEGEWILNAQDMEDSDDPVLQEYGRVLLDLSYGKNFNLADLLSTLLQHYGLYSPVLDLTSDLDIAIFFATHSYSPKPNYPTYTFTGTNGGRSVLYVFRQTDQEMKVHTHDRVLNRLKPLRPVRQSCVICRTGPYALNLAADFLIGVIKLNFEIGIPGRYTTADLFPGPSHDSFLAALKKNVLHPEHVTDFA